MLGSPAPSPFKKLKLSFDPFRCNTGRFQHSRTAAPGERQQVLPTAHSHLFVSLSLVNLRASLLWKGHSAIEHNSTRAQDRCFMPPIHSQVLARATLCFGYCSFANHLAREPNVVGINTSGNRQLNAKRIGTHMAMPQAQCETLQG